MTALDVVAWLNAVFSVGYVVSAIRARSRGDYGRASYDMACAVLLAVALLGVTRMG
jgi:hypothetical protein